MSLAQGFSPGAGYLLAMLLMSGDTGAPELQDAPSLCRGAPGLFIVASLMSLAFMGFSGFKF